MAENAPRQSMDGEDAQMVGAAQGRAPSPAPAAPSPAAPARTGTPARQTNSGGDSNSRAGSLHPDPGFLIPSEPKAHGAPVRQYLNSKVTGALLEGMKLIAREQPRDPLRVLGEFLIQKSREVEQ